MSFSTCTEAYAAGYANIPKSSPNYAAKLDRDHDGIACDQPPAGFTPHTQAGTATSERLPQTGPGEVGAAGALVLVVGVAAVAVMRRRRTRFVAG